MKITADNLNLRDISVSGQCFRLNEVFPGIFYVTAFGRLLFMGISGNKLVLSCPESEFEDIWKDYLDLDNDYGAFIKSIPEEDKYLTEAARYGSGIRILKQDPWEMLITFIISQRKNMPAIKNCVETICGRFGKRIMPDKEVIGSFIDECAGDVVKNSSADRIAKLLTDTQYYSFPDAGALSTLPLSDITACSTGYRDKYILESAKQVSSGAIDLYAMNDLATPELCEELRKIYGVGEKVANCILLFGYHRLDAFPIDVWIRRILDREYNGAFDTSAYEGFAGVIQQYMFFYETSR